MMEVYYIRLIMVMSSGYILKAEPTGYDVRYEGKREVKSDIRHLGLSKWKHEDAIN